MTLEERNLNKGRSKVDARSYEDQTHSLIDLASRMDEFLDSVGAKLLSILDECDHAAAEQAALFQKASELQQERNDWERQRQSEIARIRSECEQLAEAWTRLEEADRDRLSGVNGRQEQDSHQLNDQSVVDTSTPRASAMQGAGSAINATVVEGIAPDARPAQPVGEVSPVSILMQFQQLKRDIRNHAQRKS